jgi:osmotically-inducible protein OsmY
MRAALALRTIGIVATALGAGCSNPTMLADVATTPAENRSFSQVSDDAGIKLKINEALLSSQYRDLFFDVSSIVYQGRVMLNGKVKTAADKTRAGDLVRNIQVNVPGGLVSSANDTFIETELKVRLVGASGVKSIDFRWTAVNGIVYLMGYARSDAEAQKAIDVARNTKYVKEVVPHIWTQP